VQLNEYCDEKKEYKPHSHIENIENARKKLESNSAMSDYLRIKIK
jgi:hypothetical protein